MSVYACVSMSAYTYVVISVYAYEAMSFENLCMGVSFDHYAFQYITGQHFNGTLNVPCVNSLLFALHCTQCQSLKLGNGG